MKTTEEKEVDDLLSRSEKIKSLPQITISGLLLYHLLSEISKSRNEKAYFNAVSSSEYY